LAGCKACDAICSCNALHCCKYIFNPTQTHSDTLKVVLNSYRTAHLQKPGPLRKGRTPQTTSCVYTHPHCKLPCSLAVEYQQCTASLTCKPQIAQLLLSKGTRCHSVLQASRRKVITCISTSCRLGIDQAGNVHRLVQKQLQTSCSSST
jgi:hypothetical protein